MENQNKKKKGARSGRANQGIVAQWAFPVVLLFVVILFLISDFTTNSKKMAKDTVNRELVDDNTSYAEKLAYSLTGMTYAGEAAAAIMGEENLPYPDRWKRYAHLIKVSIPEPYLVAVVDMKGNGATSDGNYINLKHKEYFTNAETQEYFFVENDMMKDRKAMVSIVPIYHNREQIGMIYLFASVNKIDETLPISSYDGNPGFAVIDSEGKILHTAGQKSFVNQGSNMVNNLESCVLTDLTLPKIQLRLKKHTKMVFTAENESDNKTVIIVPLGINDWQLVMIQNDSYVIMEQMKDWEVARKIVIELVIAAIAFLFLIILLGVINKLRYNQQSRHLADKADTDLLTELNNKIATERKIQEYINENPNKLGMFFLFDIDNFKKINDTMGHAFGDDVLQSLGHQLRNEYRVTDIIGRTGGDEFILFLTDISDEEQIEKEGKRIERFFDQFIAGGYVKYSATASIGAAVYPNDASDYSSLYRAADHALYEAKRRGKRQLVFYANCTK